MDEIKKPINRNILRQRIGREFYILKRKFDWYFGHQKFASTFDSSFIGYSVFKHNSIILRQLKDVDMYLQVNKIQNLEIAISHLNNVIIYPGETLSLWKLIGRPTKQKGYLNGLVLNQGTIDKGIGGGLCQLGNLLFWIVAHSPLKIIERHRHGYDVFPDSNRTIPFGAGATLSYNYIDLQVKNETDNIFQIKLWLDDVYLNGELYSKDKIKSNFTIEENEHIIKQQIWGGYSRHNQIIKIEQDENGNRNESLLVENHALLMYNPFLNK